MQQVNLMMQILAGANQSTSAGMGQPAASLAGLSEPGFMLFLQQQLATSGMQPAGIPATAATAQEQSLPTAFSDWLAGLEQASGAAVANAAAGQEAMSLLAGQPSQVHNLLQAVLTSLQQLLTNSVASEKEGQAAGSLPATAQTSPSVPSAQSTVPSSISTAAQQSATLTSLYPVLAISDAWQPAIAKLNAAISSVPGLRWQLSSTQFDVAGTGSISQLPGTLLKAVDVTGVTSGEAAGLPDGRLAGTVAVAWPVGSVSAASSGGLGTLPADLVNAPAVIQWFADQGLLSSTNLATANAAGTSLSQLSQAAAVPEILGGVPLQGQTACGLVELADGETAKLTLTALSPGAQVQPGQTAEYAVRIEVPGDPSAVLTGTLSVQCLTPSSAYTPQLNEQVTRLLNASFADEVPPLQALELQGTTQEEVLPVAGLVQPLDSIPGTDLEQAPASQQAGATKPGLAWRMKDGDVQLLTKPAAQAISEADPSQAQAAVLPAVGQVVKTTSPAGVKKQVSPISTRQSAEQLAAAVEPASTKEAATSKLIEQALLLDRQAVTVPFTAEFTPLARLATSTLAREALGELSGVSGDPSLSPASQLLPGVAPASALPLNLLQFTQPEAPIAPFASLNYLELTQKVLAEANQARQAGDGVYTAKLNLNPPDLGQLYVNIAVRGETVALQLAVASPAPKSKLDESLAQLKQSLEDAGLQVVELRVVQAGNQGEGEHTGEEQPRQQRQPGNRAGLSGANAMWAASSSGRAAGAVTAAS